MSSEFDTLEARLREGEFLYPEEALPVFERLRDAEARIDELRRLVQAALRDVPLTSTESDEGEAPCGRG